MREYLIEQIELLREEMVKIGIEEGLNDPKVLRCSEDLDKLHNQLLRLDKAHSIYRMKGCTYLA
ncbi:aspartyl-phosphate phosphatase Spo0E family protein [Brevibacillus daliensis]|uniref:aspartyl-phosphate phosphatase Spo0E family protein n=1 Tax=Brevibacillus daliensis TaxID=2892995 RepID=UPI001E6457BC|nr:aspartyl-phosphate phosphatase Spo0E family protein [Brevibacillus daliensis]